MSEKLQIVSKKISEIVPYENNPRKNDKAVEFVANSIKEFGFKVPIIIDKENVVVAGHTRLKAAEQLGYKEVPCIIADDLTEEQIKAFRIADNKVADAAEWDLDKLSLELEDISLDMTEFGFGDFELTMLTKDIEPEGYDSDLIEEYTQQDENGLDQGLQSFNVIISCLNEEQQSWLKALLKEGGKLKRVYDCEELIRRFNGGTDE